MRIARSTTLVALVAAVLSSAAPASALAGWTRVSEHPGRNLDEVATLRAADGTLHVAYVDTQSNDHHLRHRTLAPNGRTWSAPATIVGPWVGLTYPDLEFVDGTLHAFWGGQGTIDNTNPTSTGQGWYATLSGGTWTRSATPITHRQSAYASGEVSSAVASDGTPWITWTGTSLLATHTGLAEGAEDEPNLSDGCCQYGANVARDVATGDLYLVWYSNVTGEVGTYSRRIAPALGDTVRLPGQAGGDAISRTHRLAAASRTTGGIYSAYCDDYPSCTRIRVGGTSGRSLALTLPKGRSASGEATWTAAAPNGRMWLAWETGGRAYAVRSNRALTRWGAVRDLGAIGRNATIWTMAGDGSTGPLDLIANATVGSSIFQLHQRVLPGLTLALVSSRTDRKGRRVLTLKATDAGEPVKAKVTLRGTAITAKANGMVRFIVPATGARTGAATATLAGYAPGRLVVRTR